MGNAYSDTTYPLKCLMRRDREPAVLLMVVLTLGSVSDSSTHEGAKRPQYFTTAMLLSVAASLTKSCSVTTVAGLKRMAGSN